MKIDELGPYRQTGIVLHIKGTELSEHFKTRAQYHGNRAELYQSKIKEIEALRKSGDELANKSIGKGMSHSDPLDSLERSFKDHQSKARFFTFSAAHILDEMVYVTDIKDLINYELAPTFRGY